MLNKLRLILKAAMELEKESVSDPELEVNSAYRKIRNLMICEILLSIFSFKQIYSTKSLSFIQTSFTRNNYDECL